MGIKEWFLSFLKPKVAKISPRKLIQSAELEAGKRLTLPAETPYARKPFLRLEQLYYSDGIIFNAINCWVELICAPGYSIVGMDEEARKYIEKWLKQIEFQDEILPKIVNHMCVYGNAYVEIIYNARGDEIVDLSDPIDPKTIDFKKDAQGMPILDEWGNPSIYIQWTTSGKPIEIPAEHIAHFKLYSLGSSQLGIGLIEPIFWVALGKRNLDEKIAQQEFRRATPFVVVKVGDKDHPPSTEEINAIHDALKNITYKTDFVGPYWYDFQFIKGEPSDSTLSAAEYFVKQMIAGLGLPEAFITGRGEKVNRATLNILLSLTQRKVQRIQKSISNVMENKIFKRIVELKGFRETPRMVWNEFSPESLTTKIDRLVKEIQVGLLTPDDELRETIRRWENLPVVERTPEILRKHAVTKRSKKGS